MLRRFFFSLLVCVGTALPALEHKPVLRALVACDMLSNIKVGTTADAVRMKRNIATIARLLGIPSKITAFRRGETTVPRIRKWISSLPRNNKDIVFFYFSGHGGRVGKSQGRWPYIVCSNKNPRKRPGALMGKTICHELSKKKSRLTIVMFDSCNNSLRMKGPMDAPPDFFDVDESELPQLTKLFLQTRGTIISSASSPEEKAFTLVQAPFAGGIITSSVLFSLKYYAKGPDVTWNTVFLGSSLFCQKIHEGQHPQHSIRLSRNAPAR